MNKLTFSKLYTPGTLEQFKEELPTLVTYLKKKTHYKHAFQYLEMFKEIAPKDVCWTTPSQQCPNPFLLYRCTCSRGKVDAFHKKHRTKHELMKEWNRFHRDHGMVKERRKAFHRRVKERIQHSDTFLKKGQCWVENYEGLGLKAQACGEVRELDALVVDGDDTLIAIVQLVENPGDVARAALQLERRCELSTNPQGQTVLELEDRRVYKTAPNVKPERWIVTRQPHSDTPLLQTSILTTLADGLLEEQTPEKLWARCHTMFNPKKQMEYFKKDGGTLIFVP